MDLRYTSWTWVAGLRKALDVDIATASASKAADKTLILNSIALPKAATKELQEEALATHHSYLVVCEGCVWQSPGLKHF